jgi:dUTP pyrophosphatase
MKFEIVSKYADAGINLPVRKTKASAGYDFQVAEDTYVPSCLDSLNELTAFKITSEYCDDEYLTLDKVAALTKKSGCKPTLVPTGIKCEVPTDMYLELSVRSSCPLKHWLILANGVGIIDSEYYNNPDNEGHIFFQIINLSPFDIVLKKGDTIGQGILKKYYVTDNDVAGGFRAGGFGSTDNLAQLMFPQFYQDEQVIVMNKVDGGQGVSDEECVMACNPKNRAFVFGAPKNTITAGMSSHYE